MENELSDNVYFITLSSSVQLSPIDQGNMKVASIAKNIITAYGVEPNQVRGAAMAAFIERAHLVGELNDLNAQIKDLQEKLKVLKKYRKVKHIGEELKALSGREKKVPQGTRRRYCRISRNLQTGFGALPVRQYSESRKS